MNQYLVETFVDPFPMIPAYDPNAGLSFEATGGISLNAETVDPFPEIAWFAGDDCDLMVDDVPTVARFTANRKALVNRLTAVSRFVPRKSIKPILQSVKISVNGTVELMGTNIEHYIETAEQFDRDGERVELVPAAQLLSVLKSLKSTEVSCEIDGDRLTVRGDAGALTIPIQWSADDFPVMPQLTDPLELLMDATALCDGLNATLFATDTESTRYALGGVLFNLVHDASEPAPHNGRLVLAGTDTRRLATHDCGPVGVTTAAVGTECRIVVPHAFLMAVKPFLTGAGSVVTVRVDDKFVEFSGMGWRAVSRLVEGRFPRYEDVIPVDCHRQIGFHRVDLQGALESAMTATSEESRAVEIKFGNQSAGTIVTFRGKSFGKGESAAVAKAGQVILERGNRIYTKSGKRIREDVLSVDPRYMLDYLKALPKSAEYVQLATTDCESAIVMTATGRDGKYIVMPLGRGEE